jgi:hypothetical protein
MELIGIGYQDYRKKHSDIKNEKKGMERYLIYFGRAHVVDHETNTVARGPLKIGRGKWATALMRGRNQPGIDFRIYAEIILGTNEQTYLAEEIVKDVLGHKNMPMTQNQQEIYDIKDSELKKVVNTIVEVIRAETEFEPLEINYFL